MSCIYNHRHVPPGVMVVVVVVVFIARDIVSNMGIPFDLLVQVLKKQLPPRVRLEGN